MHDYPKEMVDVVKRTLSFRIETGVEEVMVLTDDAMLRRFVTDVRSELVYRWDGVYLNQEFPVSEEEMLRYFVTAVHARVKYVTKAFQPRGTTEETKSRAVRTNDAWYLPAPFAMVVNMLGVVSQEQPVVTLVPVWNPDYDEFVMSPEDHLRVGLKLKRLEDSPDLKIILAHFIEKAKDGNPGLMQLIPEMRDAGSVLVETPEKALRRVSSFADNDVTHVHSRQQVDAIAACAFVIMGLRPAEYYPALPDRTSRKLPGCYMPVSMLELVYLALVAQHGKRAS